MTLTIQVIPDLKQRDGPIISAITVQHKWVQKGEISLVHIILMTQSIQVKDEL
jgi:hypothetical protein